jgi:hypothetical protein
MRKTMFGKRTGIRWKFTTQLEDLDYADDIALRSSRHQYMQEKQKGFPNMQITSVSKSTQTILRC